MLYVVHAMARVLVSGRKDILKLNLPRAVFAWGKSERGQVGNGEAEHIISPIPVQIPARVSAVAAGLNHTAALTGRKNDCPRCTFIQSIRNTEDGAALVWGKQMSLILKRHGPVRRPHSLFCSESGVQVTDLYEDQLTPRIIEHDNASSETPVSIACSNFQTVVQTR
jgi:hypothetical protein